MDVWGYIFTVVSVVDWVWRRWAARAGIRIETVVERGPVSSKYGFTETAVKVTIANESGTPIGIQDTRLMLCHAYGILCGTYGVSVPPEAPQPRSHPKLPAHLASGTVESWYFPAEKLSGLLQKMTRKHTAILRPRFTTISGRVYTGSAFRFSTDPNSHWP